jgi:TetR/AcrR family transcriptional regulator, transcriptional repressor for nem operon
VTDSKKSDRAPVVAKRGKRERLTAAAVRMLHEQGVEKTTLADIARAADVPVGNVYYYFKTKDELVEAAIDAHAREIQAALAGFERHRTPQARLKAFVRSWVDQAEVAARYGCPHGCLSQELDKRDDGLDRKGAELLELFVDWTEQQFRLMGRRDARELAMTLVATFQGASLLTNSFRDPDILVRQSRRLERWIDSLSD